MVATGRGPRGRPRSCPGWALPCSSSWSSRRRTCGTSPRRWGHPTLSGKIDHNLPLAAGAASEPDPLPMRILENALFFQKYALPDLLPWVLMLLVLPGVLARSQTSRLARARRPAARRDAAASSRRSPFTSTRGSFCRPCRFVLPFAAVGVLWAAVTPHRRAPRSALFRRRWSSWSRWSWRRGRSSPSSGPTPGALVYRQAARWIASTQPRDTTLLDRKPFVAFYSERRWSPRSRASGLTICSPWPGRPAPASSSSTAASSPSIDGA